MWGKSTVCPGLQPAWVYGPCVGPIFDKSKQLKMLAFHLDLDLTWIHVHLMHSHYWIEDHREKYLSKGFILMLKKLRVRMI